MNGFSSLLSNLLVSFLNASGNIDMALFILTLAVCLVSFPFSKASYQNMLISEALKVDLAESRKKHKHNPDAYQKEISELLAQHHYSMFASSFATVIQGILGFFSAAAFRYAPLGPGCIDTVGLDLSSSLYSLGNDTDTFPAAAIVLLLTLVLQFVHDKILEKRVITEQKTIDGILLVVIGVLCLLLPSAFCVYWLMHEIIDLIVMFAVVKGGRNTYPAKYENESNRKR